MGRNDLPTLASIQSLFDMCGRAFKPTTVGILAMQFAFEYLVTTVAVYPHPWLNIAGYTHCDIKPDNIVTGAEVTDDQRQCRHRGEEQSARSDVEALGYEMLYLLRGTFALGSLVDYFEDGAEAWFQREVKV
ncbi:hypothetical protein BDB00DRAFT_878847 [Zychaea mexicana]|uniref:uncharacterized protein n=1 Tax=Zychaea mexicana TaxID=64656 RepID=UPI0022FE0C1C|nr:uncharacterized protein BDB00DRAFT_878847 [Zychaea mexicana]KAI9484477.1 hypothetical protein BDB00DRAFT_878847 [Zychaea mexicana]